MKFSIRKSSTAAARVDCVLDALSPDPKNPITLVLRYAGETNAGYINAVFKDTQQRTAAPGDVLARWQEDRRRDADLFADHVVVGWKNTRLDDGSEAPFSAEAVRVFLKALIDPPDEAGEVDRATYLEAFDKVRRTARSLDNFRAAQASPEELGKA